MDPLARILRKTLRKESILHLKVVYSEEEPMVPHIYDDFNEEVNSRRPIPASNAFVPAAAGLIIGGEVVKDLIK